MADIKTAHKSAVPQNLTSALHLGHPTPGPGPGQWAVTSHPVGASSFWNAVDPGTELHGEWEEGGEGREVT